MSDVSTLCIGSLGNGSTHKVANGHKLSLENFGFSNHSGTSYSLLQAEQTPLIKPLPSNISDHLKDITRIDDCTRLVTQKNCLDFVYEHLSNAVSRITTLGLSPFQQRAVGWITRNGNLFIGLETEHGNPPQWGSAELGASALLTASGGLKNVIAAFIYDTCQSRGRISSGSGFEILKHHTDTALGDITLFSRHSRHSNPISTTLNKEFPGTSFPTTNNLLHQRKPEVIPVRWRLPINFPTTESDIKEAANLIRRNLIEVVYKNSTSDGKHAPATKAHAAAIVMGNQVILGVNSRDPEFPHEVRCAEKNATSIAYGNWLLDLQRDEIIVGMRPSWDAVLVFTSDKRCKSTETELPPTVCAPCIGVLGAYQRETKLGMTVVSMTTNDMQIEKLSDVKPNGFHEQESRVSRGRTRT